MKLIGNTVIVVDFSTTLSTVDRLSSQKIIKKTLDLNNTLNQNDLKTYMEHSVQQWLNTQFSQAHIEHSAGESICEITKK